MIPFHSAHCVICAFVLKIPASSLLSSSSLSFAPKVWCELLSHTNSSYLSEQEGTLSPLNIQISSSNRKQIARKATELKGRGFSNETKKSHSL